LKHEGCRYVPTSALQAGQRLIPERGLKLPNPVRTSQLMSRKAGQRLIPERGLKHTTPQSDRHSRKSRSEVNSRKGFETNQSAVWGRNGHIAGQRLIPERGLKPVLVLVRDDYLPSCRSEVNSRKGFETGEIGLGNHPLPRGRSEVNSRKGFETPLPEGSPSGGGCWPVRG